MISVGVDVSKGKINDEKIQVQNDEIYKEIMEQIDYAKNNGMDFMKYAKAFINSEPYCNYTEVVKRIEGELGINE